MISVLGHATARFAASAALLFALPAVTGCDDSEATSPPLPMTVIVSDWNGWDPEHESTPQTFALRGEVGEEVSVTVLGDDMRISVVEVDDDEVTVRTSREMAPETGAGNNLRDLEDTFVVGRGHPARFATPTMDAGDLVEIRIDE